MQSIISKLTTAVVALCGVAFVAPESKAANLTLDGYGYYALGTKVTYYGKGPAQTGRYNNLGSDYYHKITYSMDFITNRSAFSSGSISWEFWAKPYVDSDSGIILITRSLQPMTGGLSVKEVSKSGLGIYLDRRRFPEQNLWEYTKSGWKFRDYLVFPQKIWL